MTRIITRNVDSRLPAPADTATGFTLFSPAVRRRGALLLPAFLLILSAMAGTVGAARAADAVNVYSMRQPFLMQPLFDAFSAETGITVNTMFAKKGLIERMEREGANSPADVIMTNSFGNTLKLLERNLIQPLSDPVLEANIPAAWRAADGSWFALTRRARLIYASKERVTPGEITRYEDLADPKWRGRICTRSGTHPYNIQLFASMIAHHQNDGALTWLQDLKDNLARKPQGNDRAQVKAISQGECDLALGNSYYMGKMLANPEQTEWAESVFLVMPNADERGTHVNVSGMALARHAPDRDNAIRLMRYLSGKVAQQHYAEVNYEYPVNPDVEPSELVRGWGTLKADSLPLEAIAELQGEALKLVHEVGYNE